MPANYDTDYSFENSTECSILDIFNIRKIEIEEIENAIKILKPKSSCGPDGIPPYVVKGCADIFKQPLHIIFNMSLRTNTFPTKWKESIICPIPKSGTKNEIQNFRPVSILSPFAKVLETILYNRILNHVKPAISAYQHGFLKHRSCTTNLAIVTDYIAKELDKGGQVDVIYTDLSKAFDKVNHDVLLQKLASFNFSKRAIEYLASYLFNRQQAVTYKEHVSKNFTTFSGVPQGSHLGPLLFLLTINDISTVIKNSELLLFADDLKIYSKVNSIQDCIQLQQDLQSVTRWCDENKLALNVSKCKTLSFSRKGNPINYVYSINGIALCKSALVKDLGVTFDPKLTFCHHIDSIVNDSYRNLGFIYRMGKELKNKSTFIKLYYSYVRSRLEYACVIWFPKCFAYVQAIENVQSRFLKMLTYQKTSFYPKQVPYIDLVTSFNFQTLENRRKLLDLLFLYKVLNNKIDCPELLSSVCLRIPTGRTRPGNTGVFFCKKARTNVLNKSPLWRICASYNESIVQSDALDIFSLSESVFKKQVINEYLNCM